MVTFSWTGERAAVQPRGWPAELPASRNACAGLEERTERVNTVGILLSPAHIQHHDWFTTVLWPDWSHMEQSLGSRGGNKWERVPSINQCFFSWRFYWVFQSRIKGVSSKASQIKSFGGGVESRPSKDKQQQFVQEQSQVKHKSASVWLQESVLYTEETFERCQ